MPIVWVCHRLQRRTRGVPQRCQRTLKTMAECWIKHEVKTCPRCGRVFECKLNNPVHCECAQVHLSEETLLRIQEQYRDCLCLSCLTALANETPVGAT